MLKREKFIPPSRDEVFTWEFLVPVSQLIWTPVDLDPRSISTSRFGPPGPNLLVDMDPRGSKSTSKYGPPLADLDPLQKLNICNVNTII